MSLPTPPQNNAADGAGPGSAKLTLLARFLPLFGMVLFTLSMLPSSGCGHGIFSEVTSTQTATTVRTPTVTATASTPTSTAPTPTPQPLGKSFSMRGSGTPATPVAGSCFAGGCSASLKHCQCLRFSGTLLSAVVGNSGWTAAITENQDDCTASGTTGGTCCFGDGTLTTSSGSSKSPNALALSLTGLICIDPNSADNSAVQASFQILDSSTGKFANATGTGQLNLTSSKSNAFLTTLGQIHLGK